eukprot:scaffold27997_cov17-Tisochrysis_lutea.AAC.3
MCLHAHTAPAASEHGALHAAVVRPQSTAGAPTLGTIDTARPNQWRCLRGGCPAYAPGAPHLASLRIGLAFDLHMI